MQNPNPIRSEPGDASGHDLDPTAARQGAELHRVRYVLATSLAIGIAALAVVLAVFVL
ncbi:hypothetical protein [Stella sp.]|uniref:hypothetical protein n=1 Tax=Stella sp. TaxID=2912054 RepID=UPI0035AEB81E